jgi:hypothetical protein
VRSTTAALLWLAAAASLTGCDSGAPDASGEGAAVRPTPTATPATRSAETVGRAIPIGRVSDQTAPVSLAVLGDRLWAIGAGELREIDTRRERPAGSPRRVPRYAAVLESGAGALWAVDQNGGQVLRIDGARVRRSSIARVPARAVAASAAGVWVATPTPQGARIARIDPLALSPIAFVGVPFPVLQLAAAGGRVWALDQRSATLVGLGGPSGSRQAGVRLGGRPSQVLWRGDYLWTFMLDKRGRARHVLRLDARSGRRLGPALRVPGGARALAAEGDRAWIAEPGLLRTFAVHTGRELGKPVRIGDQPVDVERLHGRLWVADAREHSVRRVSPSLPAR